MKKCPNCGTVLDDDKKRCYMCGEPLNGEKNPTSFFDAITNNIGATVSNSPDSIIDDNNDIEVLNPEEIANNSQTFVSNSNSIP